MTVKDGTLTGFGNGLSLNNASGNAITGVTTNASTFDGIVLFGGSSNNLIQGCTVNGNLVVGILLYGAANGNTVRDCSLTGNANVAILIGGVPGQPVSSNNVVSTNNVHDNAGVGIHLNGSANTTVDGNQLVHNSGQGVLLITSTGNIVQNNDVSNNQRSGIHLGTSSGNLVVGNQITNNIQSGIFLGPGSNDNEIETNVLIGNQVHGISATATAPQPQDNQVHDNTATSNTPFDLRDSTTGTGTAGTRNVYASNNCVLGSPAVLCTPPDTTPPVVTAPANVTAEATSTVGAVVSDATLGAASATDASGVVTVARSGVPAGNQFPLGATTVTYTATDGAGNHAAATQTVTVTAPPVVAHGSLVRLGGHEGDDDRDGGDEDESRGLSGRYRVGASCDYGTLRSVTLNGAAVTNGQVVLLKFNDKKSENSTTKRGTLVVRGASFDLVVTCTGWDGAIDADTVHIARDGKHDEHHGKNDKDSDKEQGKGDNKSGKGDQ